MPAAPFPLIIAAEVAEGLTAGRPAVALESTIITQGMPYPRNLAMVRGVEGIIRDGGVVPATIAVMDGHPMVGHGLERLAKAGHSAAKASRRNLAALPVKKSLAGTTGATTMRIAALAGIGVVAPGGIGGVHRVDSAAEVAEAQRPACAGA